MPDDPSPENLKFPSQGNEAGNEAPKEDLQQEAFGPECYVRNDPYRLLIRGCFLVNPSVGQSIRGRALGAEEIHLYTDDYLDTDLLTDMVNMAERIWGPGWAMVDAAERLALCQVNILRALVTKHGCRLPSGERYTIAQLTQDLANGTPPPQEDEEK